MFPSLRIDLFLNMYVVQFVVYFWHFLVHVSQILCFLSIPHFQHIICALILLLHETLVLMATKHHCFVAIAIEFFCDIWTPVALVFHGPPLVITIISWIVASLVIGCHIHITSTIVFGLISQTTQINFPPPPMIISFSLPHVVDLGLLIDKVFLFEFWISFIVVIHIDDGCLISELLLADEYCCIELLPLLLLGFVLLCSGMLDGSEVVLGQFVLRLCEEERFHDFHGFWYVWFLLFLVER